jgi:hypothetical protein
MIEILLVLVRRELQGIQSGVYMLVQVSSSYSSMLYQPLIYVASSYLNSDHED